MEEKKETMKKNQRIILHKYDLVYGQEILDKNNEHCHIGYALYFKQRLISPACTLFNRVYIVRVPTMNINTTVLENSKSIVVDGYVKDGHLHIVERIPDDMPTFDPNDYESVGTFPMFKLNEEKEKLTEGVALRDPSLYDNYVV